MDVSEGPILDVSEGPILDVLEGPIFRMFQRVPSFGCIGGSNLGCIGGFHLETYIILTETPSKIQKNQKTQKELKEVNNAYQTQKKIIFLLNIALNYVLSQL